MARARTAATALSRLLQEASAPLYLLDDSRCIVYANSSLSELLGVSEEELVGLRCDYHSLAGLEAGPALGGALCPPPQVFGGERVSFTVEWQPPGKSFVKRSALAIPLSAATAENAAVLVILALDAAGSLRDFEQSPGNLSESHALHERLAEMRRKSNSTYHFDRLIGDSPRMRQVRAQAELAARGFGSVVIVGPPGSGREHLARAIHQASPAVSAGPLVPLPCALLDAETVQITVRKLKRRHSGVEREQPGTLLLLAVDEMPTSAQDELAGFLNLPEFRIPTLATSRRPLTKLAAKNCFRFDLACQLGTLVIEIPPLAGRREDIPLLAQMLLENVNREGDAQLAGFTSEALDELADYPWPGNLDELAVFVREACANAATPWVGTPDLPTRIRLAAGAAAVPPAAEEQIVLDDFLAQIERELIERALARAKGNRTRAAELLGLNRNRLLRRLGQLGLAASADETPIPFEEVENEAEEAQEA